LNGIGSLIASCSLTKAVLLDAGPLGRVTHPRAETRNRQETEHLRSLLAGGVAVMVPEIADYEVRRELLRAGKTRSIARLDQFKERIGYAPLTTEVMLLAAQLWADARNQGQPTASDESLDADVILAAQAIVLGGSSEDTTVVVAADNVQHLSRFVTAVPLGKIDPTEEQIAPSV
jgi:predicted nucleic acid-binding protein